MLDRTIWIICSSYFLCANNFLFAAIIQMYQSEPTIIDNQIYYEYRYSIEDPVSGVISEKWESRLGDYVKGRYSFLQADGLIQTVHYESDGTSGYRSVVHTSKPANSYLSAEPVSATNEVQSSRRRRRRRRRRS